MQGSRVGLEFSACLETAMNFKTLENSFNCFLKMRRRPRKCWNSAREFDGSRL